jgi:hypothetical protein
MPSPTLDLEIADSVRIPMALVPSGTTGPPQTPPSPEASGNAESLCALSLILVVVAAVGLVLRIRRERRFSFSLGVLLLAIAGICAGLAALQVHRREEAAYRAWDELHVAPSEAYDRYTSDEPFYLSVYEITEEQYRAVMPLDLPRGQPDFPVRNVSFSDVVEFCNRASERTGQSVRLPTWAEWLYAAKKADLDPWSVATTPARAWCKPNSGGYPHSVGAKRPNGLGLFDMQGNVEEWATSRTHEAIVVGGSFMSPPERCGGGGHQIGKGPRDNVGFRIMLEAGKTPNARPAWASPPVQNVPSLSLDH